MRFLDASLWAIVLALCGAVAFAPRERAPSEAAPPAPPAAASASAPGSDPARALPRERRARPLDPQMVERCLEVVRDVDPERALALEKLRATQSEQAFAAALSDKQFLLGLASLKNEDPGLYRIRIEELRLDATIDRLVDELVDARRTANGRAEGLEAQLHEMVRHKVALSLAARGKYLLRLSEHVKTLRDELGRDADPANFQPAVERRYREILEQVDAAVPRPAGG
jgi:hypothetical protein